MNYESPSATAERLGVSVRAVQKWAKSGKIKGAQQIGRQWLIPKGTEAPSKDISVKVIEPKNIFMPLLSSDFVPGTCLDFINSIKDSDERALATAEYYYYTAQSSKAQDIAELYLTHENVSVSLSACFIYTFASLSLGKAHLARLGLEHMKTAVNKVLSQGVDEELCAEAVFIGTAASVLMHLESDDVYEVGSKSISKLPEGLRLFSAYIMAHKAYLQKDFSRSIGIIDASLALRSGDFPIASLYLKLMKAVCFMGLHRSGDAKECFGDINSLALSEKFYQPFVEHHGLLQGVIEAKLKVANPCAYSDIVALVAGFTKGWRTMHNELTHSYVTIYLTPTEFAVAMLFNRGWSVKEISAHLNISTRMVKHHLSVTYEKLDVSNREELGRYLLK